MDGPGRIWKQQLSTFSLLFAGYATYAFNRKSVSFAFPVMTSQGLTKQHMGEFAF